MRSVCAAALLSVVVAVGAAWAGETRTVDSALNDRPESCPKTDWCGCWLATYLGIKDQKQWRELWVARNWASFGRAANGPAPGVIAVYGRGEGGHVGIIMSVRKPGYVVLRSGNDGGVVRERERSTEGVIAWRTREQ